MDEDINDAQKILPSSGLRVSSQSSLSAWHGVPISGREGITLTVCSRHGLITTLLPDASPRSERYRRQQQLG